MFPWVGAVMPRLVMGAGLLCRFGLEGLNLDVEPCEASVVFRLAVEAVGFGDCYDLDLVACFVLEEAHPRIQGAYLPDWALSQQAARKIFSFPVSRWVGNSLPTVTMPPNGGLGLDALMLLQASRPFILSRVPQASG